MEITADDPLTPRGDGARRAFRDVAWTPKDVLFGAFWFVGIFVGAQVAHPAAGVRLRREVGPVLHGGVHRRARPSRWRSSLVAANFTFRRYGGSWERLGIRRARTRGRSSGRSRRSPARSSSRSRTAAWSRCSTSAGCAPSCAEQVPKEVRDTRALLALASLTVIAFAPVCEELFFRGFVFPGISKRWGLVAGIVVSGVHLLRRRTCCTSRSCRSPASAWCSRTPTTGARTSSRRCSRTSPSTASRSPSSPAARATARRRSPSCTGGRCEPHRRDVRARHGPRAASPDARS